jgi:hypothetical protein
MKNKFRSVLLKALILFGIISLDILFIVGSIIGTVQTGGAIWWTIPMAIGWVISSSYAGVVIFSDYD